MRKQQPKPDGNIDATSRRSLGAILGVRSNLTKGHSKSLRHHTAMQALFIAWYNFGRKHETLKNTTPAMASGLSDHVWTIKELIEKAGEA